ncbi:MAG: WD40 repeat domain-containing protein, partial [Chloroflexota bacterium]
AVEWDNEKRDASYLLRGSDLHAAENWLAESGGKEPKPTEAQTQYILSSRRASNSRQRALLGGVSVALGLTVILALISLGLFSVAENRRQESDQRGTEVAQQGATATNALGLSQIRGTDAAEQAATATNALGLSDTRGTAVAQQASTAVAAEATSERRSTEWKSLAWAVASGQALSANNDDLALALAIQANSVENPPAQSQAALVAAAYAPGTAALYEGQHTGWIEALAVSPDGQHLLSGGYDGNLVLWDVNSAKALQTTNFGSGITIPGGAEVNLNAVSAIAFNPTAQTPTVLLGNQNGLVRLWDVNGWHEIAHVEQAVNVYSVAISPDGLTAAVGYAHGGDDLILYDANTLKQQKTLLGHDDAVDSLVFSADNTQLLSGSNDATMKLWDVASGDLIRTFGPITDPLEPDVDVRGVVFGPPLEDGTPTAIAATNSGLIIAYNLNTGDEIRRYDIGDSASPINHIAISPDKRFLVSTDYDSIVYLWDTSNGRSLRQYIGHSKAVMHAAFSPDGHTFFSSGQDGTLRRWYVTSGAEIRTLSGATASLASLALNADATRALTGGGFVDPKVVLWDLTTGTILKRMEGHTDSVVAVTLNPDGKTALSGAFDGTLRVWDLSTGQALHVFKLDGALAVVKAVYSADGRSALVSIIGDGYVADGWAALIDLETGQEIRRFNDKILTSAAIFSPDNTQILTGGADVAGLGVISLWDAQTGAKIRDFDPEHTSAISTLQYSPDGKEILSASQDYNSILWDAATGHEIRRFVGDTDVVVSAHFSPDGKTIITGSYDDSVRLWDVNTGDEILRFKGHSADVRGVEFTPDGQTAYSIGRDGTMIQWQVTTDAAAILAWLPTHRYVRDLTCSERAQYRVDPQCSPP